MNRHTALPPWDPSIHSRGRWTLDAIHLHRTGAARWWRTSTGHTEFMALDGSMVLGGFQVDLEVVPSLWEGHRSPEAAHRSLVRRWGSTFRLPAQEVSQ